MNKLEEMFKDVFEDESTIRVKDVAKSFGAILLICDRETDSFRRVREKVTEGEWNALINSISTSFLSSLYVNAAADVNERSIRLAKVAKATGGMLKGVGGV